MAESRICTACSAWKCREDDAWCGYCGAECAQLRLAIVPDILEAGQLAPPLCLKLTNLSCAELPLNEPEKPDWFAFRQPPPRTIAAGQTVEMWGDAQTLEMKGPKSADVVFHSRAGRAVAPLTAIMENPALTCVPGEIVAWSSNGRKNKAPIAIAPGAGRLKITGVRSKIPRQLAIGGFSGAALASALEPVRIEAGIDEESLLPKHWPPTLSVEYEGPHGIESTSVPINIVVRQPPQLRWANEYQPLQVRYCAERQKLELVFSNQDPGGMEGGGDNADLVIESVTLTPLEGLEAEIEQTAPLLPAVVRGGEAITVNFELNLARNAKTTPPDGKLGRFNLEVRTNNTHLSDKRVALTIEPLRMFEGVVAIDFGSSNTCCSILKPGEEPAFLRLDEKSAVSPTVIRYLDLQKTPPETKIGARIKEMAARSDEVAASTIGGLKQKLGARQEGIGVRPQNPGEWTIRKASDAATDYLREVRRTAEIQESAIFWDFVLTHPARCPNRQYRRLRDALGRAFGLEGHYRIEYLQEPIAALIPYFIERAKHAQPLAYTVASFDLGGGTTDVAVVRVEQVCPVAGEVEIHPRILSCEGENFGGENLTDYLEDELRRRCELQLKREEPDAMLIQESLPAVAKADVLLNKAALREAAEILKTSLSEEGPAQPPEQIILRIVRRTGTEVYAFSFDQLRMEGGRDMGREFLEHVEKRVEAMAGLLQPNGHEKQPIDVIQLSGKTAFLAPVGNTLRRLYPETWVERVRDPKECVVRGACLSRSLRSGRLRLVLPRGTQRTTSSIGLWRSRTSPFEPIIAVDHEIPANGLEVDYPGVWDGYEPVVLWENTGAGDQDPVTLYERGLLTLLGSWMPDANNQRKPQNGELWPLRLRLKELRIHAAVVDPAGGVIPLHPMQASESL